MSTASVSPSTRRTSARPSRWAVASRTAAGVLGGYALASLAATTLALVVRAPREEAVFMATIPAFLLYAAAVVWAFSARTALRAWVGIAAPAAVLGGFTWGLLATAA